MTALHHEIVEAAGSSPTRQLLILHGIYGAGRNWGRVARWLVRARPQWRCVLVDLPAHGRSPAREPHTLRACAEALTQLEERIGAADGVLGHSFGGKVAMMWALQQGAAADGAGDRGRQLWIVDSSPGAGQPQGGAGRMLGVLRRHPGPFGSRAEAVAAIESEGFSQAVAQWMAINVATREAVAEARNEAGPGRSPVVRTREGASGSAEGVAGGERSGVRGSAGDLLWRIDPATMEALIRDYFRHDLWPVIERPPRHLSVQAIRALGSSVISDADATRIRHAGERTGRVGLHEIEGGHWVNVENPEALHAVLAEGLGA